MFRKLFVSSCRLKLLQRTQIWLFFYVHLIVLFSSSGDKRLWALPLLQSSSNQGLGCVCGHQTAEVDQEGRRSPFHPDSTHILSPHCCPPKTKTNKNKTEASLSLRGLMPKTTSENRKHLTVDWLPELCIFFILEYLSFKA